MGQLLSLLEFVELLSDSAQVRSDFADDPDATLSAYGLDHLSPVDVQDAIMLAADNHTVAWSEAYGAGAGSAEPAPHDPAAIGEDAAAPYDLPPAPAPDAPERDEFDVDPGPDLPSADEVLLEDLDPPPY